MMVAMYILMGLGAMVAIPLASVLLFLIGFGGLVNSVAKMEQEDEDA